MTKKRKTKSQQRLEGRTIVAVVHAPREIRMELDDGNIFVVKAINGTNSLDPWESGPAGLDFVFKRAGEKRNEPNEQL